MSDQRFYLNVNNPAPCNGSVQSWRVCYYGPGSTRDRRFYWTIYAVYRRQVVSGGDVRYQRVSERFRAIRYDNSDFNFARVDGPVQQTGFACYDDMIDVGDNPLTIQAGDVVGVCVFDPDNEQSTDRRQLDVVGEVAGESLLMMDTNGCSREALPMDISSNNLSPIESRRLHIYANISMCVIVLDLCVICIKC